MYESIQRHTVGLLCDSWAFYFKSRFANICVLFERVKSWAYTLCENVRKNVLKHYSTIANGLSYKQLRRA